jgi:predicted PurR-regulated permease PerM
MEKIFQRANQYLFFSVLLVVVLYFGKTILIPLFFAALLAMLMAPLCSRLDKKGLHRSLATLTCVLIILFAILGMMAVIGGQIASFSKEVPKIEKKAKQFVSQAQQYIEEKLDVAPEKQKEIAKKQTQSSPQKPPLPMRILKAIASTIGGIVITLVFTFLMIFNKEHFEEFFVRLYKDEDEGKVRKVVGEISTVSQKYLTGRVMSILINATLYAIGLSLVGIQNAILLACIAALLTLIPYVGTTLGGLFPVVMALTTEDSMQPALWAAGVLFFIQTVDNYFIEPNIVGGEVNLSALTTIVSLLIGGMIWGVAGMILFLPMAGIVKIVCDHVEPLKPIGHLLGEPGGKKSSKIKLWIQEKLGKKKKSTGRKS